MKKFFVLLLAFIFTSLTAEAFVVKTIFFKPTDAAVISDAEIAGLLRGVQQLYADEMQRQGFGRKTFRLEEVNGNVSVHRVNGRRTWDQYLNNTWENVLAELPDRFNPNTEPWEKQDDIHIIIVGGIHLVDNSGWGVGWPHHSNRYGGNMVVAANSGHLNISLIAHELGHCFGLYHKPEGTDPDPPSLEHYEARWLDRHYHFNNRANNFTFPRTIGSPTLTAVPEIDKIQIQLRVSSDIGLHQAVVIRDPNVLVVGWDYFEGENHGTLEFQAPRWKWRSKVTVMIMDTLGNYHMKDFHVTLPEHETVVARSNEDPDSTPMYSEDWSNVNVLVYTGAVSWMRLDDANRQAQITKQSLASKGIQAEIVETEDAVRNWMLQTTSDGNVDVLILYGVLPTSIYPSFNSQPDGSVAEKWIESTDGNTILNHGDYFGFWGGGHQEELGVQNGVEALQALMDIPHITMWDFGLENNTPMVVTKEGKQITPSLQNFLSDRAFHLDELTGDWFAEKIFASDTGTAEATRADPVIVRDGNRGRIGIVYQTFNEVNPKGEVAAELISNYLLTETVVPAETVVRITPSTVISPEIGEPLTLSLNIQDGKGVAGYQATVQFDTTTLRFVSGTNGDYLPVGAFFVEPKVSGNLVQLNAASLRGKREGSGTLATLTFEVISVKASTLTLSDVLLSNIAGKTFLSDVENAQITQPTRFTADVNGDGQVNIADLVLVASDLGKTGVHATDVNGDGQVNIADLVLVAGALGTDATAPSLLHPSVLETLTSADVRQWLSEAGQLNLTDANSRRGIRFLAQLLAALTPKETVLLANYPNPFNPETWIPYQLATPADVTLTIYAVNGHMVRTLALGHQAAGMYESKSRAAYWDGRNAVGEPVASGLYFYTLTAGDFTATRKMLIRK
ncbi:MAG: dockerin type I domain-containing protein [Candidatus Poribacteria bacterium]|nr:dockerin type I domain-containing protein [Candidatus Poribacteria bacterium]